MLRRLVLSADHHLQQYQAFNKQTPDGVGTRLQELLNVEYHVEDICREYKAPHIVIGDFFNEKERVQGVLANEAASLVHKYQHDNLDLFLMVGNHESAAGGIRNTLDWLDYCGASVHSAPMEMGDGITPGLQLVMIPHHEDVRVLQKWVDEARKWPRDKHKKNRVLLGHLMIDGAKTGSEFAVKGIFKKEDLGQWDDIILGHVHEPQDLYVGSLAQRSWADEGAPRRIIILEWDDKDPSKLRRVPIPIPGPVFRTINWSDFNRQVLLDKNVPKYYRIISPTEKLIPEIREVAQAQLSGFVVDPPPRTESNRPRTTELGTSWHTRVGEYVRSKVEDEVEAADLIRLGMEFITERNSD